MIAAGLAGDVGLKILDQLGGAVFSSLANKIKNRPKFARDSIHYFSDMKLNLENELKRTENQLQSITSTAMNNNNMQYFDQLERLRSRIASVRYDLEKTGSTKFIEITPDANTLRALTILNLALLFEISILQSTMKKTINKIEDGEDIKDDYTEIRNNVSFIEEIKGHLDRANITPKASENAVKQLQQRKHVFSEIFGEFTNESLNRVDLMLASVILSKPNSFNKVEYIQQLAFLSSYYIESLNLNNIDLKDLKKGIEKDNVKAKFSDDDMEKAVKLIIVKDKRFELKSEGKKLNLVFATKT